MIWVKAWHVFFTIAWSVGLLYLPRLYVYHATCADEPGYARFLVMERKLYLGIMTPSGVLAVALGLWMVHAFPTVPTWLSAKLVLGFLLVGYHVYLGKLLFDFRNRKNQHTHVYYRWINELPAFFILVIVLLAVVKPA